MDRSRRPLPCILPPHMLREIARNGTPEQRDGAIRSLAFSEQLRGHRSALRGIAWQVATPAGGKRRSVYDACGGYVLPGTLVRSEGDPPTRDPAADEAYAGAGVTFDFFLNAYGRNSIDDHGMRLDATVHYGKRYDNAFWDGRQMVYGDGDGVLFHRFTRAVEVIAHELSHGVIQDEAALEYRDEPGALSEHFADVFGCLAKQHRRGQTAAEASWLIGEGLFTRRVRGRAIRSMKEPGTAYEDPVLGKDPQPGHMAAFVETQDDNGGVHINSGIPNRAFAETALRIGGRAWEKAGRIWYVALRDRLRPDSTFADAARMTLDVAREIYGPRDATADAVAAGWTAVGLPVRAVRGRQSR